MKYFPINKQLFIENRARFAKQLKQGGLAIFYSNDILPTNADGHMEFVQNADLFHLSGIDQEESILVIFPDAKNSDHKEILFLKETSELIAIWEGHKYTKAEATETSGIKTVYWLSQLDAVLTALVNESTCVYLNSNEHNRAVVETETREVRMAKKFKERFPFHQFERSAPIMHNIRAIKNAYEIDLIQKACNITEKGFRRLLNFVKPGVWEYEIEAELLHEFVRNRSKGFAYGPIIASGASACVLHYVENNKQCKEGDLLLLDVAAEYANYKSDLTRCIPVSGKFSPRQKEVYNAVLRVMKAAKQMLVVGNNIPEYHKAVGELMEKELVDLKLISLEDIKKQDPKWPAYKKYFMHGTSHFLGIDVHDVGDFNRKLEEGMVFTCEPGIYIKEEGIGVRIENNIVVTKNGPLDLMANIPIEVEEIESMMSA